jgi:hypothetical protein
MTNLSLYLQAAGAVTAVLTIVVGICWFIAKATEAVDGE